MSISGPGGAPPANVKPVKVQAGLAHRGDELVIVLIVESPEYLTPVTVPISAEQAWLLRGQLAAAMGEARRT